MPKSRLADDIFLEESWFAHIHHVAVELGLTNTRLRGDRSSRHARIQRGDSQKQRAHTGIILGILLLLFQDGQMRHVLTYLNHQVLCVKPAVVVHSKVHDSINGNRNVLMS